ncbi:ATP-grasp domain-containing protein [Streptomyces sp. ISL-100]|uniref:ATP-grasp domain-containing protein n=1 Tax=Streptomyces sp. ISL-100 TaxID=2819173 RepID=UPI001BED3442|nr:ATP-grasp domain-containing protein [Streptomyces sp. ISL-100]MBT2395739.1 ATP-grasp domain-containing protein [Streptomyces sp. ISL-100]
MIIVALEWLTFGLDRLMEAARQRGVAVQLLTRDRGVYRHDLGGSGTDGLDVVDLDTFDTEQVKRHLAGVPALEGLISTTDTWSLTALDLWDDLDLPGQNPAAVRLTRDKAALRNRLHGEGLSRGAGIAFEAGGITAAELAERVPFPVIVKDRAGTGSRNVWPAASHDELEAVLAQAREAELRGGLTAEPFFSGPLYSVETLSWEGETRVLGVNSRITSSLPEFREVGVGFPVAFPQDRAAEITEWITGVLAAISYTTGFAHTEFIVTDDGLEVVEINPRLGGGLIGETMCEALGVNVYDAFLDLALGKRPSLMDLPLTPVQGAAQVLLYASETGVFEGHEGLGLHTGHPGAPRFYPVRAEGDRIADVTDQRGNTAIVLTTGETTEIAMLNALSAAAKIRIKVTRDDS